ncbi:TonB-dependent receptor [Campylobacter concisus]|uniref:TonB-dependent receptor n=1 Tax=Campylobacter concisus TaxID=199 RepID=UPI00122C413E|nr:TonB-dependent receptor [Campylobacter concisus]
MPNFDAIRIGVIKKIKGEAIAISRDGTMRVLHKGDEIYLGDDIKTSENSNLTIVFDDGEKAYVGFSSVFHTINVFAEHKGELVIPKNANILENHKEHANDDDQISHQELSSHGSSSQYSASVGSGGIKFELGGHYSNIYDFYTGLRALEARYDEVKWPVGGTIKGAFYSAKSTINSQPEPNIVLNFNLTSDTGEKKGFLGGAQLNSLPKTPDGKKIITSIGVDIPDVAKNGDIITIKTNMKGGGKTSNYKVNTITNELIPVDSTGTPTGAPPIPIVNGKAEITGVEILNHGKTTVTSSYTTGGRTFTAPPTAYELNDTPAISKVTATLDLDKNGDGVIDATELGYGSGTQTSGMKFVVPDELSTGDKITFKLNEPGKPPTQKKFTLDKENGTATDEDGNTYTFTTDENGAVSFSVPNIANITAGSSIETGVVDKFGNVSATSTTPSSNVSDTVKVTLTADKNGDGLISSNEIGDGTSKVEINLPRTIKPKESVTINIGGSPKEFVVSDDGTSVYDKNNPSVVVPIVNAKFEVPGISVPVTPGSSVSINTTVNDEHGAPKPNGTSSQTTPSVVVAPPVKSAKISFDSDLGPNNRTPDGKIDTSENRYNDGDPTKTEASIKIPSVIKEGDKIAIDVTNPDGSKTHKIYTYTNGKIIAPDHNEVPLNDGKFKITVPIEHGKTTSITTTMMDKAGNKGESDTNEIKFSDSPVAKFVKDADGDGLIDDTTGSITTSDVKVYLPSSAVPKDELKISILNPLTNKQSTVSYILDDDGVHMINKKDPSDIKVISDGAITIPDVTVSSKRPTLVDATLIKDDGSTISGTSSGRLFAFGVLDYIDDVKLVTKIDNADIHSAKYLNEEDYEHIISTSQYESNLAQKINYNIALTNDEQPYIKFGINKPDTTSDGKGYVLIEIKDENANVSDSFIAKIENNTVIADFEKVGKKLDRTHHIIDATYVGTDGVPQRDDNLTITVDLDSKPDKLIESDFDNIKNSSGNYAINFSGKGEAANNPHDEKSKDVEVIDAETSEKTTLTLDRNLSYSGSFNVAQNTGSKNYIVERLDDAGNLAVQTVTMVANKGLDVDMWFFDCTNREFMDIYPEVTTHIQHPHGPIYDRKDLNDNKAGYGYHVANHYTQWMEWAGVSATTTYNELSFQGGKDWELSSTRPHKEELNMDDMAKVGHSPYAKDTDHTGAHYNLNKTGNYVLEEAEPVGTDLIMKMKGWIYIKEDGQYNIAAKHFQDMVDVKIADESFGKWAYWFGSGDNGPHGQTHPYNLKKGFYRIEVDYVDRTKDTLLDIMIKKSSQNPSDYKIIGSKDSGTHLFSDSYVKALHDKGYVSDEKDGLIAGKKGYRSLINQEKDTSKPAKYFGDDADDFNKVIHLKHNTDALEGSNLNDVFIYNGKNIDAKGGVDKLIFVEDTKLEKVSNLNDNLKSFERLQLGTENQAVSISFNTKNVLDIIDSRTTKITEGEYSTLTTVSGTESINTVLKILGDSNDIVKLINDGSNKFELATNEEVTLLNWKHSKAIGGSYNKVETDGNGHIREFQPDPTHNPDVWKTYKDASGKPIIDSYDTPVNHVYKGTYTDGANTKTFFVEIDKNIKITHEGDDQNNTFTYEGNKIDAKGGVDTLIFTENIDLSRVDDLNDKLKSFETLQLGSNSTQAVSIGLDAKSVLDIIDSQVTDGGLKSVNTVLKIKGDNNDKVALEGKGTIFAQATDSEVAALNLKHSALGDTHNQVAIDSSGHAVNQVYKGVYGSGAGAQTFFIEIDKDVSVVNLVH